MREAFAPHHSGALTDDDQLVRVDVSDRFVAAARPRHVDAIGARLTADIGGRRLIDEVRSGGSFCSQNDLRIHLGVGARTRVDRIEVAWPSGAADTVAGVDADQLVIIREGSGVVRREGLTRSRLAACGGR